MKSKNKNIFVFLLALTLIFSSGLASAYGDTGLTIYGDEDINPGITNIDTSSAEVETVIGWDTDYPEILIHLEYREAGSSTWTEVIGSEQRLNFWDCGGCNYETSIAGLDSNKEYEVRSVATEWEDSDGNRVSEFLSSNTESFTTDYEYPSLEDPVATSITKDSATLESRVQDLGSADSLEVWFNYREQGGTYTETTHQTVTGEVNFLEDLTGLSSGTVYESEVCAYDSANNEQICQGAETFETDSLSSPSISTLSATNIDYDSAGLRGEVNSLGDYSSVDVRFSSNSTLGVMSGITESETTLSSPDTYSYKLDGLGYGQTYKYAFSYYDTETSSWVTASEKTFTTLDFGDLTVNVDEATNITGDSATLNGNVNLGDYENATARFQYRESEVGSWITTSEQNITSSGSYNQFISGLDSGKTYDYQAEITSYCSSAGCTSESITSDTISFTTTTQGSPEIKTVDVTEVTSDSVLLNSELLSVDESTIGIFWEYRESGSSEWNTLEKTDVSSPTAGDTYSKEITGLNPNSDYEYRAGVYSYELDQNYYGSIKTFITQSPPWKTTDPQSFNSAEEFDSFISNLEPDTDYEFRAVMEYDDQIDRGETLTFQTSLIPPQIINDLGSVVLEFQEKREVDLNENYQYWDSYTVQINGENVYDSKNLTNEDGDPILNIDLSNDILTFTSYEEEGSFNGEITLTNQEGSTIDEFTVEVEPSFFQKIVNSITGIFPDSDDLSGGQKFAYVLVSMLVISIVMIAIGTTTGGVSQGIMILTGILNFLIFMFYIAIGYISLWILITLVLIAIAISYFKFRGGE